MGAVLVRDMKSVSRSPTPILGSRLPGTPSSIVVFSMQGGMQARNVRCTCDGTSYGALDLPDPDLRDLRTSILEPCTRVWAIAKAS